MKLSPAGAKLIQQFEGCRLQAYQDVVGIWTVGYGHTLGVKMGDVWTQEKADSVFFDEASAFAAKVDKLITAPVTQHQFDACVSLAYNVGVGNFSKSTLLRLVNLGKPADAALQFAFWNHAGGKVNDGLTKRRAKEAVYFMQPDEVA